ncbi:MAG TPA: MFS transporter [Pseudolabrys sp.]|nr:MFS transporter [Pseudolabrys sp.]
MSSSSSASTVTASPDRALIRAIFLMSVAAFCSGASLRVSDPLLPQVAKNFGASIGEASAIVTAYAVPYGLTQIFSGVIGDRLGKCQAVALVCGLSGVLVLLCAASQSLTQLTIARLLCAPGAAIIVPLGLSYIGDVVPYHRRQAVLARYMAGQMMGMISGQIAGGIIGDHFGWRMVFVLLGGVFILSGLALASQFRSNPWTRPLAHESGNAAGMIAGYRALAASPWCRFLVLAVFIEGAVFFGGFTYIAANLHARFGLSFSAIGVIVAAFGLGCLVFAVSVQRIAALLGERGLLIGGGAVVMVAFLTLAGEPVWEAAPIACALLGFGYYMLHNTLQTHATQMLPKARGTAMAGFSSALYFGQSVGVAAAAPIVDRAGAQPVFAIMAVLWLVMALWIAWRVTRQPV